MAITTYAQYRAMRPHQVLPYMKNNLTVVGGRMYSRWFNTPLNGALPSTALACSAATAGSLPGALSGIACWIKSVCSTQTPGGSLLFYDRLTQQGGLSGTVEATAQTTNLPTAALTRYTSGAGVFAALEIYTAIGTTATTATVSYTNSSGTSGRTSATLTFGGSSDRNVGSVVPLPMQAGDNGVRSVESVTLAATTGTAGNFGVTLLKPLLSVPTSNIARASVFDTVRDLGAMLEPVLADACLGVIYCANTSSSWISAGRVELVKQV